MPRQIRDAEHEPVEGELSDPETPGRRLRLWIVLVAVAALIADLWYCDATRG